MVQIKYNITNVYPEIWPLVEHSQEKHTIVVSEVASIRATDGWIQVVWTIWVIWTVLVRIALDILVREDVPHAHFVPKNKV